MRKEGDCVKRAPGCRLRGHEIRGWRRAWTGAARGTNRGHSLPRCSAISANAPFPRTTWGRGSAGGGQRVRGQARCWEPMVQPERGGGSNSSAWTVRCKAMAELRNEVWAMLEGLRGDWGRREEGVLHPEADVLQPPCKAADPDSMTHRRVDLKAFEGQDLLLV